MAVAGELPLLKKITILRERVEDWESFRDELLNETPSLFKEDDAEEVDHQLLRPRGES